MQNGLFSGLNADVISALLSDPACASVSFAKGEVIFDPEHFSRRIGVILSGSARVMSRKCGGVTIRILTKDMCFGVAAQYVQEGIRRSPELAENYIRFLTSRIRYLNALIDAYSSPTVESKLARYLVAYTEGNEAPLIVGMSELSRILGVGRASLYRAMDAFVERRWIARQGKTVKILDLSGLKTI